MLQMRYDRDCGAAVHAQRGCHNYIDDLLLILLLWTPEVRWVRGKGGGGTTTAAASRFGAKYESMYASSVTGVRAHTISFSCFAFCEGSPGF